MNTPNPTPETPEVPKKGFIFSEEWYQRLKFLAMILLPALTTFYATMGNIWDWPNVEEVVASTGAFDLLLGALLGISTKAYQNANVKTYVGSIVTTYREAEEEGKLPTRVYSLDFDSDPVETLETKDEVVFRVVR